MAATIGEGVPADDRATDSVLIVDDDWETREILTRLLAPEPYTLLAAADTDDAVRILEGKPVSVVLCDRFMPGRDGLWLVAHICEHFPEVAIILATADDSVPPRFTLQPGVVGYLVKPFNPALLLSAVRDAMVWHRAAARRRPAAD